MYFLIFLTFIHIYVCIIYSITTKNLQNHLNINHCKICKKNVERTFFLQDYVSLRVAVYRYNVKIM